MQNQPKSKLSKKQESDFMDNIEMANRVARMGSLPNQSSARGKNQAMKLDSKTPVTQVSILAVFVY